jgi:hypothetical protein
MEEELKVRARIDTPSSFMRRWVLLDLESSVGPRFVAGGTFVRPAKFLDTLLKAAFPALCKVLGFINWHRSNQ